MSATDKSTAAPDRPIDLVALARGADAPEFPGAIAEGRRQMEICNACRYCEGYCAVFPAMTLRRAFTDGDMTYLANLCHNCRACHYACQYAAPHEFAINVPRALAEIRNASWQTYAWPAPFAALLARAGATIALAVVAAIALVIALSAAPSAEAVAANAFYAYMPHTTMVALFATAFGFALVAMGASIARYWRATGSPPIGGADFVAAVGDVLAMRNLSGGHGEGCNYEDTDAFSNLRRRFHQFAFHGFMLCFLATSAATVLHYVFDAPAPYGLLSLPKLFGIPGGFLLALGTAGLLWLRTRAEPELDARGAAPGDVAFTVLLLVIAVSGLALYALRGTALIAPLLWLHLGAVLGFFAVMPYTRMVHGLYRTAALIRYAAERRSRAPVE